jgi:thiol-disulfide isomerase/thioredoxin
MDLKQKSNRSLLNKIGNLALVAAIAVLLFSGDAKSWLLRQMISVGLFKAEVPNESAEENQNTTFSFIDADGRLSSTADLNGKVVFINFWASWCPPCRAEMPSLHALYEKLKDDDRVVFLFINEDDDIDKANVYLNRNGYSMPVIRRNGQVPEEIFTGTLPTTIVLNRKGQIVLREEGLANYNTDEFVEQLKALR